MIRLLRLRRRPCLVLMLAVATSSGCINSDKFTSGRLPYGSADGLAATAPRDPFLTGSAASSNEQHIAATAPTTPLMNYSASPDVQSGPAPNHAAMPAAVPPMTAQQMTAQQMTAQQMTAQQMTAQQMLAQEMPTQPMPPQTLPQPYYLNQAESAAAPMTDTRQAAYTPSDANPFNTAASHISQPMPAAMPASPSNSAIEQISYEMPVGMPAEAVYEENPFAEVQGQPVAASQNPLPQIQPMHGAPDAWQSSATSSSSFAGNEFLPPQ